MFENEQDIVDTLLADHQEFQVLFKEHSDLKERVKDAEQGVLPMEDLELNVLKREKLRTKDRMSHIIEEYRRAHA